MKLIITKDNKPGVPKQDTIPIEIKFTGILILIEETNKLKLYKNINANNTLFNTLNSTLNIFSPSENYALSQ